MRSFTGVRQDFLHSEDSGHLMNAKLDGCFLFDVDEAYYASWEMALVSESGCDEIIIIF